MNLKPFLLALVIGTVGLGAAADLYDQMLTLAAEQLPSVAPPAMFQPAQAPDDPHDPAPWMCDVKADAKHDIRACECQLVCYEDGSSQESAQCKRFCVRDKCLCHMEETCKAPWVR